MKKLSILMIVSLTVASAIALDWQTCLEYKFQDAPEESWELNLTAKGMEVSGWKLTNAIPTQSELQAIEPAAIAWKRNQKVEEKADLTKWKDKQIDGDTLADAYRALVICINKRLPATNQITVSEFKAALKTELQK